MLRSMYAGVSGLNAHQQMMDVTGNNISNVNTIGFKSSRVTFKEMLSQTIQGASAPQANRAGTNPQQVGLGVGVGSIDSDMSSGNLQSTGKTSDVAIQGDGFFVLRDGNNQVYSRAGNLNFDENGRLYSSSTGMLVQGWMADANGDYGDFNAQNIDDITLKQEINAQETDKVKYGKNLDAGAMNSLEILEQNLELSTASGYGEELSFSLQETEEFNVWDFTLNASNSSTEFSSNGETFDDTLKGKIKLDNNGNITSFETNEGLATEVDLLTNPLVTTIVDPSGTNPDETLSLSSTDVNNIFTNSTGVNDANVDLAFEQTAKRNIAVDVFDSQGGKHTVVLPLEKTANNEWQISDSDEDFSVDGITGTASLGGDHTITFDANGNIDGGETVELTFTPAGPDMEQTVELDFSAVTQFDGSMTANFTNVNGYEDGALESFSFTETGDVVGSYSNGLTQTLAKLGLANFSNPAGLMRQEGVFQTTSNSGDPELGAAAQGGFGSLAPATLEMSNANLSQEFTNMITAQRGFQASSKLITTSDEMLQELVNLKR
ncbi:flagellar hook protein FlgE [Halanaerobium kushneri]|uniref:Flagellar hook protein FlgE n=1 Tax=Halanaerobium kushneri TaxID=56779 RepID=A0A1N6UCL9_9FIRM|nr:flagellar hook protein FlgE [Halanaerobium kushneri]SIQ63297.1 flagellar hook protein FlgE [Halanaerobium kushneri]